MSNGPSNKGRLEDVVARAQKSRLEREQGYRERALKMYPWICGRCQREFTRENLRELTVHHRNHDHDYNPEDGSNWELLCLYCHDNEHQRQLDATGLADEGGPAAERPENKVFAGLEGLLRRPSDE